MTAISVSESSRNTLSFSNSRIAREFCRVTIRSPVLISVSTRTSRDLPEVSTTWALPPWMVIRATGCGTGGLVTANSTMATIAAAAAAASAGTAIRILRRLPGDSASGGSSASAES